MFLTYRNNLIRKLLNRSAHVVRVGVNEVILAAVGPSAMTPLFVLCSRGEGSAHQVTFTEVSLPRSIAISRNCSRAASRSSTISWAMTSGTIYRKWLLRPYFSHGATLLLTTAIIKSKAGQESENSL